jgi:hypothetical protein
MDPDTGLNVIPFVQFLAILAGSTHLLGAYLLNTPPVALSNTSIDDSEQATEADEHTSLLPRHPASQGPKDGTALELLRDPSFWMLWMVTLLTLGAVSQCHLFAELN